MNIKTLWHLMIHHKGMLYFLLICNLIGTIYGYIWYGSQLDATDLQFKIFVQLLHCFYVLHYFPIL